MSADEFPLKRDNLPLSTFLKLKEELFKVFSTVPGLGAPGSAKFYGMGEFSPQKAPRMQTIASLIQEHPDVKLLLETFPEESEKINFGDYLYKRILESEQHTDPIRLGRRVYVYGYFLFLGFQNKEAFEAAHGLSHVQSSEISTRVYNPGAPPTVYIGSFFSFRGYQVKHFVLTIDFKNMDQGRYPAEEWGFHRLDENQDQPAETERHSREQTFRLHGGALVRNNKLYVNLATSDQEQFYWTQMNLIGWLYGAQIDQVKGQRIIRCSLQTVSVLGYPVVTEAVLVRVEEPKWANAAIPPYTIPSIPVLKSLLGDKEFDTLLLYLMMQRRNFWIRDRLVDDLSLLQVRGNLMQNYLFLRGSWRVWNYGLKNGYVVQSKLTVYDDFSAYFYSFVQPTILESSPRLKEMVVVMSISRGLRPNKLYFSTYVRPDLSVINNALFDLDTIGDKGFAEGMFLSCGYDAKGIIGGYCVMQKLRDGEPDFEPAEFNWEEAVAYAAANHLDKLHEGLRDLWRRKTWPRRKGRSPRAAMEYDPEAEQTE